MLRIDPSDAQGWNNLGKVYLNGKKPEDAIECFKKTIKLNNKLLDARFSLAQAYEEAKQTAEAQKAWQQYIELAKDKPSEMDWLPQAQESLNRLLGKSAN